MWSFGKNGEEAPHLLLDLPTSLLYHRRYACRPAQYPAIAAAYGVREKDPKPESRN